MGNTNVSNYYLYNKLENRANERKSDIFGPFIFPQINDFKGEVEDYYKNKTLIEKVLKK